MTEFRFFHPIEVRYRDVDSQRHVNNAAYFTYMEQARLAYMQHLGLWDGEDFDAIGIILAEQSCAYKVRVAYGQPIHVGVRISRLGNKSLEMVYTLRDRETDEELAAGWSILVAFDYQSHQSIPVPQDWRTAIQAFEG
jgi:acyl-CoA thioester hydrolase